MCSDNTFFLFVVCRSDGSSEGSSSFTQVDGAKSADVELAPVTPASKTPEIPEIPARQSPELYTSEVKTPAPETPVKEAPVTRAKTPEIAVPVTAKSEIPTIRVKTPGQEVKSPVVETSACPAAVDSHVRASSPVEEWFIPSEFISTSAPRIITSS